jgi:pimeloyl-ACP methyl ester carboxylesterase
MRPMPGGAPREFKDHELAGITTPVLYVVGENERVCSDARKALARLNSVAPRIQTELIPGCGHDLFWMRPDDVSGRVLDFLDA